MRGFGLKVGEVSRGRFEARVEDLITGDATLGSVIGAMLRARAALWSEFTRLHREMLKIGRADPVCRRLTSVPGVGALVAVCGGPRADHGRKHDTSGVAITRRDLDISGNWRNLL